MVVLALVVAVLAFALAAAALVEARRGRQGRLDPSERSPRAPRPSAAVVSGEVDARAVRHVAVVRYDAFPDLGGQLSYSVALLDTAGDGVVLSAVNGRSDGRSYAKGVLDGHGEQLTPEERQAVSAALAGPTT